MLCPKCNFKFNEHDTDTCPACQHQAGKSMYLDAAVKINDDSIIVDENIAQAPDRAAAPSDSVTPAAPINDVFKKIIESKTPGAGAAAAKAPELCAPPRYPQQERRKTPRNAMEKLPTENAPASATGAKSLAISVCIGAVVLVSCIGAGIYYLKYKASGNAPARIGSKPLILPQPSAPAPTYKTPAEEKQLSPSDPAPGSRQETAQHAVQAPAPAPDKAPGPISDTARQEIKAEPAKQPAAGADVQQRSPEQANQRSLSGASQPAGESTPPGRFVLLCGSFKSRQKARNTAEKLKQQHYPAVIEEADLGAKGFWYRIKVGGFSSKDGAEKTRNEIKRKMNIDAIVSKKN